MMNYRSFAALVAVVGVSAVSVALIADAVGLGGQPGYGSRQLALAATGASLILLATVVYREQGLPPVRRMFALSVLVLATGRGAIHYASAIQGGGHYYQTADWLINYGGGFVRRGLFGHLFLQFAPTGAAGLWLLFSIQVACYALVLLYVVQFLQRANYSWSSIALACGPAALPFIGWDTAGGFRKEILVFVVLVLLAWARSAERHRGTRLGLIFAAVVVWTLAIFSWEPSALMLPVVAHLLQYGHDGRAASMPNVAATVVFVGIAAFGLGMSVMARGDARTATSICAAMRAHGFSSPMLCDGAIAAIAWTSTSIKFKLRQHFPMYLGYLPLTVLALTPIVSSPWFRRNWKWTVATGIAVLPLYVVALDYGRWAHMIFMALAVCVMAGAPGDSESALWTPLASVLYISLWGMPHWLPGSATDWPWLGLLAALIHLAAPL